MVTNFVIAAALGMLGGVANSILLDNGFALPRTVDVEAQHGHKKVLDPGFLGNLVLGALAAAVVFLLGGSELPVLNGYGVSLLSGVGGGNLLTSMLQKYESNLLSTKIESLQKTVQTLSRKP